MGCDIHICLEVLERGQWLLIGYFHAKSRACERNYDRFAAMAGVRGEGPKPQGMPSNAGEGTLWRRKKYGGDGHSESWLPLKVAGGIYAATYWPANDATDYYKTHPCDYFFDISDDDAPNYRIVFWFDN
jgi:hypothetical protein